MKLQNLLSTVALFAASALPVMAHADTLTLTLSNPVQTVTSAGDTLTFSGVIAAPASNVGAVYIYGLALSFNGPATFDANADEDTSLILNGPATVDANNPFAGDFFTITIPQLSVAGQYVGLATLQGGSTDSSQDALGSAAFEIDVVNPPAGTAVTPEPSSLLLLATGAVWVVCLAFRRGEATAWLRRHGVAVSNLSA